MNAPRVIAIDGPAASGKSSTAAAVARRIGALHLDSGALYRCLARVALDLESRDPRAVIAAAEDRAVHLGLDGGEIVPFLDGRPAEAVIRSAEVTRTVSEIAALAPIRDWVNQRLRAEARSGRLLVLDGRDIGTDVFPDAPLKVFLTATADVRAERRLAQRGEPVTPEACGRETSALRARDAIDSSRAVAPLRRAPDAMIVDTTRLSFDEQVAVIVARALRLAGPPPPPPTGSGTGP